MRATEGTAPVHVARFALALLVAILVGVMTPRGLTSQDASVEDFAWMTGEWVGEGPDGSIAEIDYMPPAAGVLPAVFRLWKDDRVVVLELITLVEEEDGLFMYVRHFDPALVPLEKDRAIRLKLVAREGDALHFENQNEGQNPVRSHMIRTSDGFLSWSELARSDGSTAEIRVAYRRKSER